MKNDILVNSFFYDFVINFLIKKIFLSFYLENSDKKNLERGKTFHFQFVEECNKGMTEFINSIKKRNFRCIGKIFFWRKFRKLKPIIRFVIYPMIRRQLLNGK